MISYKLKYVFVIQYASGAKYQQSWDDLSKRNPLQKSAWYDAAYEHDLNNQVKLDEFGNQILRGDIIWMELRDAGNMSQAKLDLRTCTLIADRTIIQPPDWPLFHIRPIYFRRVCLGQNISLSDLSHPGIAVSYFIGWQANDATGRNHQRTLEIM